MEPGMNENGKRASGYMEENGVKRTRFLSNTPITPEDVRALERRVGLLEHLCAGMQQEMAAMRLQLSKHVEKRAPSNYSIDQPQQQQQSVPKGASVIDVDSDSSADNIPPPRERDRDRERDRERDRDRAATQVPVAISTEKHISPPSPNPSPSPTPTPTPTHAPRSFYNSPTLLLHPNRTQQSQYDSQNPHLVTQQILARQNAALSPSPQAPPPRSQSILHSRLTHQGLRTLSMAQQNLNGSIPQTLSVSPISNPSPQQQQQFNKAPTHQKASPPTQTQPLVAIKEEVPPFRPPLPYLVDEDLTIEKEMDTKKNKSPLVYEVEEHTPKTANIPMEIADEVMVVGARQGANLPHSRYYCPNNKFTFPSMFESTVMEKPLGNNAAYCPDCFCYVCDCKASECKFWSTPTDGAVHCNAYALPKIWKQLRTIHRNPLFIKLHQAYQEKNPVQSRKYVETELTSDVTRAIEVVSVEPRASELSCALEFYHDINRRARPCVCDCHARFREEVPEGEDDGCWKCDSFHDLHRPGWVTIHSILERLADEVKGCLGADDLSSLSDSPQTSRKLAQATVSLDIITEKLSTTTWKRSDVDPAAENLFRTMVRRLCYYWVELLLDAEFTPEVREIAAARLKRLTDAAAEPCFKEIMGTAVAIGEKGWDHPDFLKIASGQSPSNTNEEGALLPVCLRVLYRGKQWDKLFAFLRYAGQKGTLGSSQLLPLAMARVGQFHEAVNWCLQHMNQMRINIILDVGSTITDMEEPNDAIVYAAFRLGILALHKSQRKDYAPSTKPDLACWLIKTLSGRGLSPAQLLERNTPGPPTPRLQSVRQTATRIFTFEEHKILTVLRGPPDGGSRAGLATTLGVEEALLPHVMLEISLLLCIGALDMYEVGRVADTLKKNDDMFGIISLAFHMPQDQESIMNFVVANVLPKMGTTSAPGLVEKWITNPNISDFLLVQFVALFIKEGNSDRAFAIGERIVATHKSKSSASRFSTYCAMTKLAELLWPLAIEAGKIELAKTLAQSTFDEAPSWKNLELLQKSYSEQEWTAKKEQLLSLIRTGQAPYVAIPSVRRLELLARSGRFADAASVLQETSSSSPEEANIISDVLRDLKKHSPEKIEEFAKSILSWLEMMTYRGYADDIWLQLAPLLPQFCIGMLTKFQEQLEEQFDRKTVQENDRRLMVFIEASNEAAWNNRMRRLVSGPLRRKSALMTSIKATAQLFDHFPPRAGGEQPPGTTSTLPLLPLNGSSGGLNGSREGLNINLTGSREGLNTSSGGLNHSKDGLNNSKEGILGSGSGSGISLSTTISGLNLNTSLTNSSTSSMNTSANGSSTSIQKIRDAVNLSGSSIGSNASTFTNSGVSSSLARSSSAPSLPGFNTRLTPVPVSSPLTPSRVSPNGSSPSLSSSPPQQLQRTQSSGSRSPTLLNNTQPTPPHNAPLSPPQQQSRQHASLRQAHTSLRNRPSLTPSASGRSSSNIPLPLSPNRSPQPPSPTSPYNHSHSHHQHHHHQHQHHQSPPRATTQDKNLDIHLFQHFVGQLPSEPVGSNTIPSIRLPPSLDLTQHNNNDEHSSNASSSPPSSPRSPTPPPFHSPTLNNNNNQQQRQHDSESNNTNRLRTKTRPNPP